MRVQITAVREPPAPDAGVVIFGAEAPSLPIGSLIQPLPPERPVLGGRARARPDAAHPTRLGNPPATSPGTTPASRSPRPSPSASG